MLKIYNILYCVIRARLFIILNCVMIISTDVNAQTEMNYDSTYSNKLNKKMSVHGEMSISNDLYKMNSDPGFYIRPRRPNELSRLVITPSFHIGKDLVIPVNILLSSRLTSSFNPESDRIKLENTDDLLRYIQNPINIVNIGLHYKRLKLALGTHFPRYTELTMGEIPVFGAGIDVSGSGFIFKTNFGYTQNAIESDSLLQIPGAYKRQIFASKIGFGTETKSFLAFNAVRTKDLIGSVNRIPLGVKPMEGLVMSSDFRIKFSNSISWGGEISGAAITRNLMDDAITNGGDIINEMNQYYKLRMSTSADASAASSIDIKRKTWELKMKGIYVGSGYESMMNPFFQADRLDITLNPKIKFWKERIVFNGSMGRRTNNLSGIRSATLHQFIYSGNVDVQLHQNFSFNLSYGNFGVRNDAINDTLRIQNVSHTISFAPVYSFQSNKIQHVFSGLISFDEFQDYNIVSGKLNDVSTYIFNIFYNASWKTTPFTLGGGANKFQMSGTLFQINSSNFNLNIAYAFFKRKLRIAYQPTFFIHAPISNLTHDEQLIHRINIRYAVGRGYKIALTLNNNNYKYGAVSTSGNFTENYIQTSVSKEF